MPDTLLPLEAPPTDAESYLVVSVNNPGMRDLRQSRRFIHKGSLNKSTCCVWRCWRQQLQARELSSTSSRTNTLGEEAMDRGKIFLKAMTLAHIAVPALQQDKF